MNKFKARGPEMYEKCKGFLFLGLYAIFRWVCAMYMPCIWNDLKYDTQYGRTALWQTIM